MSVWPSYRDTPRRTLRRCTETKDFGPDGRGLPSRRSRSPLNFRVLLTFSLDLGSRCGSLCDLNGGTRVRTEVSLDYGLPVFDVFYHIELGRVESPVQRIKTRLKRRFRTSPREKETRSLDLEVKTLVQT